MFGNTPNPVKPLSFSQNTYNQSPGYEASQHQGFGHEIYSEEEGEDEEEEEEEEGEEEGDEEGEDNEYDDYQEEGNRSVDSQGYDFQDPDAEGSIDEDVGGYQPEARNPHQRSTSDLLLPMPAAQRQSIGEILDLNSSSTRSKPSKYGSTIKNQAAQLGVPGVDESDEVILQTEALINRLFEEGGLGETDKDYLLDQALESIPGDLIKLWASYDRQTKVYDSEEYAATIGPGTRASKFSQANFIASLALKIQHPPSHKPLPQVMLEWIDEHHDPYISQFEDVQAHRPSPANHPLFWETVFYGLLRGRVVAVVNILKNAGWKYARAGMEDVRASGLGGQAGYTGLALTNVEKVVNAAVQVLSQCPAVHGDWNIRGSDWTLFRIRVAQALDDLKTFAEGKNRKLNEAMDFGKTGRSDTFSRTARKAESQVPWTIYQNLLTLYGHIGGDSSAILASAQDWCEASVGLLVWWDEGKEDKRLTLGRSPARAGLRDPDAKTYIRKLRLSFDLAISESTDFEVNSLSLVEVGLATLFEGDIEAVVELLRAWSGPVSSALAEIANLAGWLPPAEPQNLINMGSLDQDDMDILGINSSPSKADGVKDKTLITYAKSVADVGKLQYGAIMRDGWEISIAIYGRLDSPTRSEDIVGNFLKRFPLESSATVDKLWQLLNDIGMSRHAENVAEVRCSRY
jgi:hypothetical protein